MLMKKILLIAIAVMVSIPGVVFGASYSAMATWAEVTQNEVGEPITGVSYILQRKINNGEWTTVSQSNALVYIDNGQATGGDILSYRVGAIWEGIQSAWSNEASYTLPLIGPKSPTITIQVNFPITVNVIGQ